MGEPLSFEQYRNIQDWIPPLIKENEHLELEASAARTVTQVVSPMENDNYHPIEDSDADLDDIQRYLTKKFEELAMKSLQQRDYEKAETFLRKLIERGAQDDILLKQNIRMDSSNPSNPSLMRLVSYLPSRILISQNSSHPSASMARRAYLHSTDCPAS